MSALEHIPQIGIVMPFYNEERYLEQTLKSIVNQSFTDWQLWVVDDHSTDKSAEIVLSFAQKDARIQLLKAPDKGLDLALQFALEKSDNPWITRMDADDLMPERKLELMLENAEENTVVTGKVKYFHDQNLHEGYVKYENWLNELGDDRFKQSFYECVIPSPAWLMRRSDLIRIGGFTPELFPEDYDLCFRMFFHDVQVKTLPDTLHYWRDHLDRTTRVDDRYNRERFFLLKVHYLLKWLKTSTKTSVTVWGAGKKGKHIVRLLQPHLPVFWCTNNIKKQGHDIYGITIDPPENVIANPKTVVLISVAKEGGGSQIKKELNLKGHEEGKDYWVFC